MFKLFDPVTEARPHFPALAQDFIVSTTFFDLPPSLTRSPPASTRTMLVARSA